LSDDNKKENNNLIDEELPITLPPKKNAFNKKRNSSTSDESDPNEDDSSEIPSHHDSFENQDYSPESASLHDSYENPSDNLDSSETEANDGVPPTNGESTSVNMLITKDPLIDDTSSLLQDRQIVLCDNLDLNGKKCSYILPKRCISFIIFLSIDYLLFFFVIFRNCRSSRYCTEYGRVEGCGRKCRTKSN
jgi:hypothetical protein